MFSVERLEDELASAEKENEVFQKELRKSYEEMNKRIEEHDRCVEEGKNDKLGITMQVSYFWELKTG